MVSLSSAPSVRRTATQRVRLWRRVRRRQRWAWARRLLVRLFATR